MILTLWALFVVAAQGAQARGLAPAPVAAVPADRVEVVLFSDFQCPFCAALAQPVRQLETKGVDGIPVVVRFRHFPLAMHPHAPLAHEAALAAMQQGKFWEMHDLLFANQRKAERDDVVGYARALGLDLDRFQKDMDSAETKARIASDQADGQRLGITATPTYFINGKPYVGARSYDQLTTLIAGERRRTRALSEVTDAMVSIGPAAAPVIIELFADLESPVSASALAVVDDVLRRYPSDVRLQFRNMPLSFHPGAARAHEAAMTAAKDGRFWEFARGVLASPPAGDRDLTALAGRVGLDEAAFERTLAEHRYAARVEADLALARTRGIRGSPALLVNGRRIDGVPTLSTLTQYVDAELMTRHAARLQRD
jgi:protein-disulfide isomerase